MTSRMDMWHHLGGSWGPFEWLFAFVPLALMIAFWFLILLLVAKLVGSRRSHMSARSPALNVLEERYARGEITRDEFLERKAVLSEGAPTS